MTIGAGQSLPWAMFRMTEGEAKSARIGSSSRIRFLVVTNSARSNLSTRLRFAARCVAVVTLVVRRDTCGNRQRRCTPAGAAVAGGTSAGRPGGAGHVLRVIELDVEALAELCGKTLQRRV